MYIGIDCCEISLSYIRNRPIAYKSLICCRSVVSSWLLENIFPSLFNPALIGFLTPSLENKHKTKKLKQETIKLPHPYNCASVQISDTVTQFPQA